MQQQPQRRDTTPDAFPSAKARRSPESSQYDELKGKLINIELLRGRIVGTLKWVDTYTLGVQVSFMEDGDLQRFTRAEPSAITMVFKNNVIAITKAIEE